MAQYPTADFSGGAAVSGWHWTGLNTLNMFASIVRITEPIYARQISVYWAGYGNVAFGFHCIWRVSDAKLIVRSDTVRAPQGSLSRGGQYWMDAPIAETYLEPGLYFVGVWCNPQYRRVWSQWSRGTYDTKDYLAQGLNNPDYFADWYPIESDTTGVLGAYIGGEPASRVNVKVGSTWRKGSVFVKNGNNWNKAKAIYVKVGNSWQRSK